MIANRTGRAGLSWVACAALATVAGCGGAKDPSTTPKQSADANGAGNYTPAVRHGKSTCILLDELFNNDAIAAETNTKDGNFDLPGKSVGDSFSWTNLPDGGKPYRPNLLGGVVFIFPDYAEGKKNNVACNGQEITVKPGAYKAIYILGASEAANQEDEITLVSAEGEKTVPFKLTDWCQPKQFGEVKVIEWDHRYLASGEREEQSCSIWAQSIPIPAGTRLTGLRLPDNPHMHVFALSLQQ